MLTLKAGVAGARQKPPCLQRRSTLEGLLPYTHYCYNVYTLRFSAEILLHHMLPYADMLQVERL
jgi:hypothetical protein